MGAGGQGAHVPEEGKAETPAELAHVGVSTNTRVSRPDSPASLSWFVVSFGWMHRVCHRERPYILLGQMCVCGGAG